MPGPPEDVESTAEAGADPLEAAWTRVDREWEDPDAHRKFLALCLTLDRLPEAGRRYRKVRESHPDEARRKQADAHIDQLLTLAMKNMEVLRTPPPENRRSRLFFVALGVAATLVGVALYSYLSAQAP